MKDKSYCYFCRKWVKKSDKTTIHVHQKHKKHLLSPQLMMPLHMKESMTLHVPVGSEYILKAFYEAEHQVLFLRLDKQ